MENTKKQLQKSAQELNRCLNLNPPIDINIDRARLEVEICKRIYGLISSLPEDQLPNVLLDLMLNGQTHSPNEN